MFSCNNKIGVFLIGAVFMLYTLFSLGFYTERTLGGSVDNHILAAEMFGTPKELKERGLTPLYKGDNITGWDGQFYYYMANDIFALKDTADHIDAPSYRYQRVGMSLYASIFSKIIGMDWVSPKIYILSYLILVFFATLSGAYLFSKLGLPPALILLWSLSVGTQVTIFNALPDAAADAFLILAITAVFNKKYLLSIIPFVFSGLSREVYVLFPSFILLFLLFDMIKNDSKGKVNSVSGYIKLLFVFRSWYLLAIPSLIAVIWRIYVTLHFDIAPSEQATNILGFPLVAWWEYFSSGISGHHKLVGAGVYSYAEAASLFLFLIILITTLLLSALVFSKAKGKLDPLFAGVSATVTVFSLLYISFGSTVIMHYTGYFKAIAVMFFILPFLSSYLVLTRVKRYAVFILLLVSLFVTTLYNMDVRILPHSNGFDKYTNQSQVEKGQRVECFEQYHSKYKVTGIEMKKGGWFEGMFGSEDLILVDLEITNTSENTYISTQSFGSVYSSYHWVDSQGKVVTDGVRSAIVEPIAPGETFASRIVTAQPDSKSKVFLQPSLVQEGCAWFYMANPSQINSPAISITR